MWSEIYSEISWLSKYKIYNGFLGSPTEDEQLKNNSHINKSVEMYVYNYLRGSGTNKLYNILYSEN